MSDWKEFANERSDWRTETGKNYELDPAAGFGQFGLNSYAGPIHYQENGISGAFLDIDTEYVEDKGTYFWYPKMHNKVSVFKDHLGYEIISPSGHLCRMELISVDGINVNTIPNVTRLTTFMDKHPFKVGIRSKSSFALNKDYTVRWKITEIGNGEGDKYSFSFKPQREAYSVEDILGLSDTDLNAVKLNVQSSLTRIDDTSFYLDEIWPRNAKLINPNTDFYAAASGDDGYGKADNSFGNNGSTIRIGNQSGYSYIDFVRFPSVSIGQGATISTAVWNICSASYFGATITIGVSIGFYAVDNATAPTDWSTVNDEYSNHLTAHSTSWSVDSIWSSDTYYSSPSIVSPLQDIVSRAGYVYNNAILLFAGDTRYTFSRYWYAYDNGSKSSYLSATWTGGTLPGPSGVKTWEGLAIASVKTIEGLALSSVKTIV